MEHERYARYCDVHPQPLVDLGGRLRCPAAGGHWCATFRVVDRATGRVVAHAGVELVGITVPEGDDLMVKRAAEEKLHQRGKKWPSYRVKLAGKFYNGDETLKLRLMVSPYAGSPTPYQLRMIHANGQGRTEGTLALCKTEEEGVAAFEAECAKARKLGWQDAPYNPRKLKLVEIPRPGSKGAA